MSELINERICDNCKRPFGDHFWPSLGGRCTQNPAGTKFIPIAEPSPEPEAAPEGGAARKVVRFAYLPIGARFRCGRAGTVVFQKTDEDHAVSLEHPGSDPFNFELSHPCYVVEAAAPASEAQPGTSALYVTKAAYDVRLAELTQLRARVAILDAQKVELPEKLSELRAFLHGAFAGTGNHAIVDELFNGYLDALRAVQAKNELLRIASEEVQERRNLNGLPPLDHIGRWEHKLQLAYDALAGKGE